MEVRRRYAMLYQMKGCAFCKTILTTYDLLQISSFFDGSGRAQVYTDNNNAATGLRFYSQGYDQHPPSSSSVESCNAAISISDMDFQGKSHIS